MDITNAAFSANQATRKVESSDTSWLHSAPAATRLIQLHASAVTW